MKTPRISWPSLLLGLVLLSPLVLSAKTPIILITDIGTDIDDSWAIALALRSPEVALKLIVVDPADTAYRAKVTAKLLEDSHHTEIPIAVGENTPPQGDGEKTLLPWIAGYDISKYPGVVLQDGVSALIDAVDKSGEPVTIVGIGPVHTLELALRRRPDIATKARFVGMYGSFDVGYGGSAPSPETNVRVAPAAFRTVMAAKWRDILLTPLDTCGFVGLAGDRYRAIWSATSDPLLRAVIQSYCIFAPQQSWMNCDYFPVHSTTLFDCVAVYLSYSEELVHIENIAFDVTDDGYTRRNPNGAYHARVAISWKNLDGFDAELAGRLLAQ